LNKFGKSYLSSLMSEGSEVSNFCSSTILTIGLRDSTSHSRILFVGVWFKISDSSRGFFMILLCSDLYFQGWFKSPWNSDGNVLTSVFDLKYFIFDKYISLFTPPSLKMTLHVPSIHCLFQLYGGTSLWSNGSRSLHVERLLCLYQRNVSHHIHAISKSIYG
jgi:hypothetical protein